MPTNPMNLTIPTPGVTTGPEYATQVSDDLTIIASHQHTGASNGDGLQIPTAGLDINEDLSMQGNNLISARSARMESQAAVLAGIGDLNCLYVVNGNLFYNNNAGTPIQITSGAAIDFSNNLNYALISVTNNHIINYSDVVTLVECDSTSNTITITLPAIANVPAGRLYIVKDFKGTSQTNNITVSPAGTDKIDQASNFIIRDNHLAIGLVSDGIGNWSLYAWNRKRYFGETISMANSSALTLDSTSNATIGGTLDVGQDGTFSQDVNISGGLQVGVDADIGGDCTVSGTVTGSPFQFGTAISGITRVSRQGFYADSAAWAPNNSGVFVNGSLGLAMQFAIDPPNGATITSVTVSFQGASGHADLPQNKPSVALKNYNTSSQLDLTIGSQSDTSVDKTAYELQHPITITGLSHTVNRAQNAYHIVVTAESGSNSATGAIVYYYSITYTRPSNSQCGND